MLIARFPSAFLQIYMDFTKGIFSLKQKAQMNQYTKTAQRYLIKFGIFNYLAV